MLIEYTKEAIQADENWQAAFHCAYCSELINQIETVFASWMTINPVDDDLWGDADCLLLCRLTDGRYMKLFASDTLSCDGCSPFSAYDPQGNMEFYNSLDELLSPNTLTQSEAMTIGIDWNPSIPPNRTDCP